MISLTFTAEASDFASDDAVAEFFGAIASAFRAARRGAGSAVGAARAALANTAAAIPATPASPPVAVEAVAEPADDAGPAAAEVVQPAKRGRKPRAAHAETEAAPTEPAPAAAPAAPAAPAAATAAPAPVPTLEELRASANRCISRVSAAPIAQAMKACGAVKYAEIKERHRRAFIRFCDADGNTDIAAELLEADLADDAGAVE